MKRILGIILAVLLLGGVGYAIWTGGIGKDDDTATKTVPTTTVHGVIGSEKQDFFDDPAVIRELARKGYTVDTVTSGSWAMSDSSLKGDDFAFPSSSSPADALVAEYHVKDAVIRPFYSPLVVVAHRDAAQVLAANGLATLDGPSRGTLHMADYLAAAARDTSWQQLKGASGHSELTGTMYIMSTDPASSNSGALFLADASYVKNGGRVVSDRAGIDRTAPLLRKLTAVQGAQQSSSDGPFRDFISGSGSPLVLVYESQVASLLQQHENPGDMVVLYPDVTVDSDHSFVPLTAAGKAVGDLLLTDPALRRAAVRYGFRPRDGVSEFDAATVHDAAYLNRTLSGVGQAAVPTTPVMEELVRRATG